MLTVEYEEMFLDVQDEMEGDNMWPDTELEAAILGLESGWLEVFKED